MENTKKRELEDAVIPRSKSLSPCSMFRVGMWIGIAMAGTLEYIAQDVYADNAWSALGSVILNMRITNPEIYIRPGKISVVDISGSIHDENTGNAN